MPKLSDRKWLQQELSKVVTALGETLSPFCEVILSDLTDPDHVITQIENNISGRAVGDPASEMGLVRLTDPTFPDVLANFANTFEDGRSIKSTSVGIRDKSGNYIAILCLNIDVSYLKALSAYIDELTKVSETPSRLDKIIQPTQLQDVSSKILAFAAKRNRDPRSLTPDEKRELLQELAEAGDLERRGAIEKIASTIGVTRSNLYYYLKKPDNTLDRTGD